MRLAVLLIAVSGCCSGADNVLTAIEQREGFVLLFDGHTFHGWRAPSGEVAWKIEDGCLRSLPTKVRQDLLTEKRYGNFELRFDWRISHDGNTGVKYRIQKEAFVETVKPGSTQTFEQAVERAVKDPEAGRRQPAPGGSGQWYTVAYEFQLIDDEAEAGTMHKDQATGALYSMIPPERMAAHKPGEWNQSRLVVKGEHFEHWINGVKVLEGSLKSEVALAATRRRWADAPTVREMLIHASATGPIALQHHGAAVWFKNLKIRVL